MKNLEAPSYYYYPEIYLEVDTEEDFELINVIFKYFDDKQLEHFSLSEIIEFLSQNNNLIKINNKVHRRWKRFKDNA